MEKYEIGKWYKFHNADYNNPICYAKFVRLSECDRYWFFSEYINMGMHCFYNGNWLVNDCKEMLYDLSEIKQYLPEDHPDRIIIELVEDPDYQSHLKEMLNKLNIT